MNVGEGTGRVVFFVVCIVVVLSLMGVIGGHVIGRCRIHGLFLIIFNVAIVGFWTVDCLIGG